MIDPNNPVWLGLIVGAVLFVSLWAAMISAIAEGLRRGVTNAKRRDTM